MVGESAGSPSTWCGGSASPRESARKTPVGARRRANINQAGTSHRFAIKRARKIAEEIAAWPLVAPSTLDAARAMGPGELADLAGKKAEELTAEEIERLMSNPQIRELQYKLAHGGDSFKLEVTNEAPREVRNVRVPEGASEGERAEAVRAAMAEQQRNEQRDADAAARRKRKEHEELMARSDAWAYVLTGAGTEGVNGRYARNGEGVKNGARVYVGCLCLVCPRRGCTIFQLVRR